MFSAKIILDSISEAGARLTTMEVTFPRIILAEINTHRAFSRNSASSRAIPVEKMIQRVLADPFIPTRWGKNQQGMQAEQELTASEQSDAAAIWLVARNTAVDYAQRLLDIGVHKQITNRLLEPWLFHTALITATDWDNFFALRTHPDSQPEMQCIATLMLDAYRSSVPSEVLIGHRHLPLVPDVEKLLQEGFTYPDIYRISIGRCARVSYLTHHGTRDPKADLELCDRLIAAGHMSPTEHVAVAVAPPDRHYGNFRGWLQYRKSIPNEANFGVRKEK